MKTGTVVYCVQTSVEDLKVTIGLENLPSVEEFTEEAKGVIALEVLKSLKSREILNFVIYSEESTEKRVNII